MSRYLCVRSELLFLFLYVDSGLWARRLLALILDFDLFRVDPPLIEFEFILRSVMDVAPTVTKSKKLF